MSLELRASIEPRGEAACAATERQAATAEGPGSATTRLGLEEFASLLGVAPWDLPSECRTAIVAADFGFTPLEGRALGEMIEHVVSVLESPLSVSGPERKGAWQTGWSDILSRFLDSGGDLAELEPHYFRRESSTMRIFGRYVQPHDPRFEANFVNVMHAWIARRYLADAGAVYEFGCGPGHNLVALARLLPDRPLIGLDWAPASQEILQRVSQLAHLPIEARRFDMFAPDASLEVARGSAVVTIGAMEQLGERFDPFLEFLLERAPEICVHLEPIHELYDRCSLFDCVAARYAEKRGYLRGFLPRLTALQQAGDLELLEVRRHLGSQLHDGWGSIVWRPRRPRTRG